MKFTSEEQYIKTVAPAAQKAGLKYRYLPSVLIGQTCLENGYGLDPSTQSLIDHNNMLGIKSELLNASWDEYTVWSGKSFVKETPEVYNGKHVIIRDSFRVYETIDQSFEDYCLFMTYGAYSKGGKPKYRDSVIGVDDPETVITNVSKLGYATDPNYPKSVMKIINKWNLTQYDIDTSGLDKLHEDMQKVFSAGFHVYRLYNPNSGEHFYTTNSTEAESLIKKKWKYEGIGWTAPSSGDPVFRLYNPNAGDHHYTMSYAERSSLVKVGWMDEGIAFASDKRKAVPLYRAYNPNVKAGSHNYTTSKAEQANLISLGWKDEGIGWYGIQEIYQ